MIKKTIFYLTVLAIGILGPSTLKYVHAKTTGSNDCMIQYINGSYPNGCTYEISYQGKSLPHIDKCGIENNLMKLTGKVNGCRMYYYNLSPLDFAFNTSYCYIARTLENNF